MFVPARDTSPVPDTTNTLPEILPRRRRQLAGDIERVGDVERSGILNARTLTERTATERQRTLIVNLTVL